MKITAAALMSLFNATPFDGVYLDAKNMRAIGEGLVPVVKSQFDL